jgi:hypothetical protein
VWVNRLWQWHFGVGLVATSDDFGVRGAKPSNQELLDWLASELIESGWSTKHIQRLIVTSRTFRMTSSRGGNRLPLSPTLEASATFPRRRVEAEVLRDSQLAVAGLLNRRIGGPSVPMDARESSNRRNLYLFQKRGNPPSMQGLFDGPSEASESCPQRHVSTTPLHALFLLNNEFTLRAAFALAQRVESIVGPERGQQIDVLFREVLSRPSTESERIELLKFLDEETAKRSGGSAVPNAPTPLQLLCHVMLSLSELSSLE